MATVSVRLESPTKAPLAYRRAVGVSSRDRLDIDEHGGIDSPGGYKLVKSLVFGGVDGLGTTLALVWGAAAVGDQSLSLGALLVLGWANLLAKGCSMGLGDYLGSEAEAKGASTTGSVRSGLMMFASFVLFGGFPLLAYLPVFPSHGMATRRVYVCLLCALSLFGLGVAKARLTSSPALPAGLLMMVVGGVAAAMSFGVGKLVHFTLGVEESEFL
eukprot:Sspe_Gene.90264::Locus_61850_Transcript_1_1_Confidence_1.000_Length_1052::g.90264::m.90264